MTFRWMLILLLTNLIPSTDAFAWGSEGHREIARIAWSRLTPEVQKTALALLNSGDDAPTTKCSYKTIEDAATWLDCVRGAGLSTYFANYYHADRATHCPALVVPTKCATGHCASDALNLSIQKLGDLNAKPETRRIALKVIIHLLGDLHQPLHVERDANSFSVSLDSGVSYIGFHEYWDKNVLGSISENKAVLEKLLGDYGPEFMKGSPDSWTKETFEESKSIIYGDSMKSLMCNTDPTKSKVLLTKAYQREASHYAYYKVSQAGVRLASILNELLRTR